MTDTFDFFDESPIATKPTFDILNTRFRFLGTVERFVWPNSDKGQVSDDGFAILAVIPENDPITDPDTLQNILLDGMPIRPSMVLEENSYGNVVVKGPIGFLTEGQTVVFVGQIVEDRRGQSFQADYYELIEPGTEDDILRMLETGIVKHIGYSKAKALVGMFGLNTLEVLSDPNAVTLIQQVSGIGPQTAPEIVESWQKVRVLADLVKFLAKHGITFGYAMRVWRTFKHTALARIQENPYSIIECWGIGFAIADQLGRAMGLVDDDPRRIGAGIIHRLDEAAGNGHTYLDKDELVNQTVELFNTLNGVDFQVTAEMISNRLYEMLPPVDLAGRYIDPTGKPTVVMDGTKVYRGWLLTAEMTVAEGLQRLAKANQAKAVTLDWQQVVTELNEQYAKDYNRPEFELHEKQINAIQTAVAQGMAVIVGGPGTGKSTIVKSIISLFRNRLGLNNILLAAPTGRAAKRMEEATGHPASTIHRLLEYSGATYGRDQDNPLDGSLLIVDEASMIDISLMQRLVTAIPDGMRLVVVGDKDQLPSVGPGNVLQDIMNSGVFPVAMLDFVFRQQAGSLIKLNAQKINRGDWAIDKRVIGDPNADFFVFSINDAGQVADKTVELASGVISQKFGYSGDDIQVLSPQKNGAVGINSLNKRLQAAINPPSPRKLEVVMAPQTKNERVFRQGDRVMIIRNNYDLGLMNGDIGKIHDIVMSEKELVLDVDGELYTMSFAEAGTDLTLAYACTIHKVQGSESPCVIMIMHPSQHMMLMRNLLYTGITRASRCLILITTPYALKTAVENNVIARRNSALCERLQDGTKAGDL